MRMLTRSLTLIAVLALALPAGLAQADDVVLEGTFTWSKRENAQNLPLKGTFTPAGEGKWTVSFDFDWKDKPNTYVGEITGSLSDGELEGFATTQNKKRKWVFSGTAEGGVLKCSHKEVRKGQDGGERLIDTGTFSLGG